MILVPHLETDVTQACQLSCVGCNHAVPLWRRHGPWTATAEQVMEDLMQLSEFMHAKSWGALGGEPLLNKNLVKILHAARWSEIADAYEVWTNGLLLPVQPEAFWDVVDTVVISRYPGKLSDNVITLCHELADKYGKTLIVRDEINEPNFMTWLEPTPTNKTATALKYTQCDFRRGNNYAASYGYFFMCCCGPHIPMLVQGRDFGDDGLLIKNCTEETLRAYIERSEPLIACQSCAGRCTTAHRIPWREERDVAQWIDKSAGRDGVRRLE